MAHVRGSLFLNTFAFLREVTGLEAPQQVLSSLPREIRTRVERPIRDSSWQEFTDLMVYMRAAKDLFGRDDPQFFHRMGYFSGQRHRQDGGFEIMVPEPKIAVQMSGIVWRTLYDVGRVEVIAETDRVAIGRIHDFPPDAAHCQRICGALEGLLTGGSNVARAEETQCTSRGAPHCEIRIRWL